MLAEVCCSTDWNRTADFVACAAVEANRYWMHEPDLALFVSTPNFSVVCFVTSVVTQI